MQFNRDIQTVEEEKAKGRNKRKRESSGPGLDEQVMSRRKTRSQGAKDSESQLTRPELIPDSEEDDYQPSM